MRITTQEPTFSTSITRKISVTQILPRPLIENWLYIRVMAERDSSPLSPSITRGLTDKLVERRKGAALELER